MLPHVPACVSTLAQAAAAGAVAAPPPAPPPAPAAPGMFGELLLSRCAAFTWPLLACSCLVWAVGLARLVDPRLDRGALVLGRLSSLSVSFGLLGTVVGMIGAFADGQQGETMARSIAVAYWTTGFGIASSIAANAFGLRGRAGQEVQP